MQKEVLIMANIMKRNRGNGGLATLPVPTFGGFVDTLLQNALNRFFDDDMWARDDWDMRSTVPVNIRENEKEFEMEIVAPGLKKEDFRVHVNNNVLTVSFEHNAENKEGSREEGYLRHEYRMQSFSRRFTLDESVDTEKIGAEYKDGILYLTLPKKEGARSNSKAIKVK